MAAMWQPSAMEQQYYGNVFRYCDTAGTGVIPGRTAVPFLSRSGLQKPVLRQVRGTFVVVFGTSCSPAPI